ncbi:glycosyltransferase family 1 protein [Clostridium diolis]|uniref:glycosyltransferase n=1 Tax=Clostridium diolis TaxID=223919 RepID=UPI000B3FE6BC|nr:glycosyltransferase [Clostridium diolis]OVE67345.1 glycosyltransferase family 1 protein [Clostridium diolis]
MKKILFAASTLSHIENFHIPYLEQLKEYGYTVHVMGKTNNKSDISCADKIISIPFEKNMFSLKNFSFAFKISKIIRAEKYDIISIHTSLAAFFVRVGIMLCSKKPRLVINTVHGYLFDSNTSSFKRNIMLLAEKFTKYVTDVVIVMNSEDYSIAKKNKLYKKNLFLVNGMGIDLARFPSVSYEDKILLRLKFNYDENDFILIYVAEFSKRKNQKFLLDSVNHLIKGGLKNIKLLLLGDGQFFTELKSYASELNISDNVIFAGYIKDTKKYYQISDICVSSSRIEGLPFNIMEAMSVALPVVASKVKGHTDLIIPGENGFLFEYNDINDFCSYINTLYKSKELRDKMSIKSKNLSKMYSVNSVLSNTVEIIRSEYDKTL